ncbi:MAG: agmatinase [Planctomycetota bacterium]|jgi:agmatinase
MTEIDPNAAAASASGLYGLSSEPENAQFHVFGVPFEATTSFRMGTARGPAAILRASHQVELFDLEFGRPYEAGIAWMGEVEKIAVSNAQAAELARSIREMREAGEDNSDELQSKLDQVNEFGAKLNNRIHKLTSITLGLGKTPVFVGGDHSIPFGAWKAAAEAHPGLGLLQFDAHADLREAYEGFTWSHASVMNNALREIDGITRVVQVGVRDICDEELSLIAAYEDRIRTLFDRDWVSAGDQQRELARDHIAALPNHFWITFDIDGLEPMLCPNTGTPVPGGLDWHGIGIWLSEIAKSGKRVIGIDLVEVAPGNTRPVGSGWDEIIAARLLYRLIGAANQTGISHE